MENNRRNFVKKIGTFLAGIFGFILCENKESIYTKNVFDKKMLIEVKNVSFRGKDSRGVTWMFAKK